MEVGLYIRDYKDDPDRPMLQQVEEAAEGCRLAPDAEGLTSPIGILLLSPHNPVGLAEQAMKLDHFCSEVGSPGAGEHPARDRFRYVRARGALATGLLNYSAKTGKR